MHVLGMTTHTRQILAKGAILTPFSPKVKNIESTPGDDPFSSEIPWESSFQGIDTPSDEFYNINSNTSHLQSA